MALGARFWRKTGIKVKGKGSTGGGAVGPRLSLPGAWVQSLGGN